ncbi:MAG: hypothetical protein ACKODB_11500 [Betaproteobacteria bacterium]
MVEFNAPVFWTFLFIVGLAVFKLHGRPAAADQFLVPLYPVTPLLFCASCGWLAYSSITYAASRNAVGVSVGVMAVGLVALVALVVLERRSR